MGMIPKKIKSENKVSKSFSFANLVGIFVSMLFGYAVGQLIVYPSLLALAFIPFCVGIYLIASSKCKTNPKKTFIQGLIDFIRFQKNNKVFYGEKSKEYIKSKEVSMSAKAKREKIQK